MFRVLDNWLDNIKSPYWEVYLLILVCGLIFAIGINIVFQEYDLLSVLGNVGSFMGAVITGLAVFIAFREYKNNKKILTFDEKINLKYNLIPTFTSSKNKAVNLLSSRLRADISRETTEDKKRHMSYLNDVSKELMQAMKELEKGFKILSEKEPTLAEACMLDVKLFEADFLYLNGILGIHTFEYTNYFNINLALKSFIKSPEMKYKDWIFFKTETLESLDVVNKLMENLLPIQETELFKKLSTPL